jgi:hypothetical protein
MFSFKIDVLNWVAECSRKTPARKTSRNPESYCIDCRRLSKGVASRVYKNGRPCSGLV